MELKTYVRILKHRWVSAVVGLLLAFGVTFTVTTLSQVPKYKSEGVFSIKLVPGRVIEKEAIPKKPLQSRIDALTNRDVLRETRDRMKKKGYDLSLSEIKQSLQHNVQYQRIVKLSSTHRNKEIPRKLLQVHFEVYTKQDKKEQTDHLRREREDVVEELNRIQSKISERKETRDRMSETLKSKESILVKKDPQTVISRLESQKNKLYNRKHQLDDRRETLIGKLAMVENLKRGSSSLSQSGGQDIPWTKLQQLGLHKDHELSVLLDKYQNFRVKKQGLLIKYTNQHPQVQSLNQRLNWIRREIISSFRNEPLQRKHNELRNELKQVNDKLQKNKRNLKKQTERLARMKELQKVTRELNQLKEKRTSLQEKKEEVNNRLARKGNFIQWDREPTEPERVTGAQRVNNLLLSLAFSLIGAVGSAYLVEYFSSIIRRPKDVRLYFGINPIASVPTIREDNILDLDPSKDFPARELFNKLAVFFDSMSLELNSSTFLITSSRSGEGKSVLCANIGISLARSGENVLLVDSDFRKPIFHKNFNLQRGPGFTDFLKKHEGEDHPEFDMDEMIEQYSQTTSIPGLRVLTAGQSTDNPLSLLKSTACQDVFRQLRDSDYIVLCDSPPIGTLVDGAVVAGYVSGTILVVAEGEVQRTEAARVKHTLNQVGANTIGAIINKVELEPEEYYYYYRYYQGGKYGY